MTFGETVRRLRKRRGLTLQRLASMTGLRKGYLSNIENRKVNPPSPRATRRIAKALGADARRMLLQAHVEKAPPEIRRALARAAGLNGE